MRKFFLLICTLLITSYLYGCSENDTAMPSNAATYTDNNEVNTDDISQIPEQTADTELDSNNSMTLGQSNALKKRNNILNHQLFRIKA